MAGVGDAKIGISEVVEASGTGKRKWRSDEHIRHDRYFSSDEGDDAYTEQGDTELEDTGSSSSSAASALPHLDVRRPDRLIRSQRAFERRAALMLRVRGGRGEGGAGQPDENNVNGDDTAVSRLLGFEGVISAWQARRQTEAGMPALLLSPNIPPLLQLLGRRPRLKDFSC